jgi:magnesium transporter
MVERKARKRKKQPGARPGTLVHVGTQKTDRVRITLIDYAGQQLEQREIETVAELATKRSSPTVTWINVDGLHDTAVIEELGKVFDLHPLILEDVLSTQQRTKMEHYENCIFIVLKMLSLPDDSSQICSEQVSLILGTGYVLSFQEAPNEVFEPVRQRIRSHKGRICGRGPDYLLYALVDAIVDNYFVVLDKVGENLEILEDAVFENATASTLAEIQRLRVELLRFRKAIRPLRETINGLVREEDELISDNTRIFLRDVYDHAIQVIDTVEGFRDTVSGLLDVYLSVVSNRMNEVMKVLTIIATIFIPLTFIAGIYGMNFEYMPELKMAWAYPFIWLTMLVLALGMLWYFRRKGWL